MSKEKGAVIILYVTIVSMIALLLLAVSQSRFLLAIKRNQSSLDNLNTTNLAESMTNDYLARIVGGYVDNSFFPINHNESVGDIDVEVEGVYVDNTQTIKVKAKKGFSTSQIQATRQVDALDSYNRIKIILAIDCTSQMDAGANCESCTGPTKLDAQKEAVNSFIENIERGKNPDKYDLGVVVYGIESKWLEYDGIEIKPNNISLNRVKQAISQSFSSTRSSSPACQKVMDGSNVGSAYSTIDEYYKPLTDTHTKKIAIVVSGSTPNSTTKKNACSSQFEFCPGFPKTEDGVNYCESNEYSWECYRYEEYAAGPWGDDNSNQIAYDTCEPISKRFLSCNLADTETFIPELGVNGNRDIDTDAYAITIYKNSPDDVIQTFRNYSISGGHHNITEGNQLDNVFDNVYNQIVKDKSIIKIKRLAS